MERIPSDRGLPQTGSAQRDRAHVISRARRTSARRAAKAAG
jgi:hypothetical protein